MTRSLPSSLGHALTSSLLALLVTGCAGDGDVRDGEADSLDTVAPQDDALARSTWRSRHRFTPRHDGGAVAGTGGASQPGAGDAKGGGAGAVSRPDAGSGSDDVTDCAVCARANECCNAINAGALCTFSADTCASLAASSREPYIVSCKTLLDTVASVRAQMPASCQ